MNNNDLRPLAIYIHIPFCEQKCRYCDFLSAQATDETKYKYVNALLHEIMHTDGSHHIVTSVFIGGGTPSCVQSFYIVKIMEILRRRFKFAEDAEISMEVNPGTVRKSSLADYKLAGVNRLSIGLQSTFDDELRKLGRIHDYKIFLNGIRKSLTRVKFGFFCGLFCLLNQDFFLYLQCVFHGIRLLRLI